MELWADHLGLAGEDLAGGDPITVADTTWRQLAAENAEIVNQGERPLVASVHRYEPGRMPGSILLDEAESLTFEH